MHQSSSTRGRRATVIFEDCPWELSSLGSVNTRVPPVSFRPLVRDGSCFSASFQLRQLLRLFHSLMILLLSRRTFSNSSTRLGSHLRFSSPRNGQGHCVCHQLRRSKSEVSERYLARTDLSQNILQIASLKQALEREAEKKTEQRLSKVSPGMTSFEDLESALPHAVQEELETAFSRRCSWRRIGSKTIGRDSLLGRVRRDSIGELRAFSKCPRCLHAPTQVQQTLASAVVFHSTSP